jgi:hypothetical protein
MKIAIQVIILSLVISMLGSCSNGWSVGNLSSDSTMYSYVEIIDVDSTSHFYADKININSDNWCFTHSRWEVIRKK